MFLLYNLKGWKKVISFNSSQKPEKGGNIQKIFPLRCFFY